MGTILLIAFFLILFIPALILIEIALLFFTLLLVISNISILKSKRTPNQKQTDEEKTPCQMIVDDTMDALGELCDVVDLQANETIKEN